jgi:voltage-gated potassium channel Kch
MSNATLRERAQYAFDNSMSRGTIALIGWLSVVTFGFLFVSTFVIWLAGWMPEGTTEMSLPQTVWYGLMRTLDSGTMGGDEGSWPFKLSMLWITLGGVFVVSTLIGVLNNGIEASVDELRKGRSRVIEQDHTVILNWSPHIFTILGELVQANANRKDACVVILAERDKVEMEDAIRDAIGDARTTRIVCRSGSPMELKDLDRVAVQSSRSIIVLAEPGSDDPDSDVIKAVLALTNGPNRREAPYHITAEIQNPDNVDAARLVGRKELEIVVAGDLISRVTVQTCRQSGLSVVHTELLDFGGDEIYFKHEPSLAGKTFGDALHAFEDSALIGLRAADGSVRINPPMSTVIQPDDKVIAISEDDDTITLSSAQPKVQDQAIRTVEKTAARPESTLILGWNWKGPRIVTGLDDYVAEGSTVTVLAEADDIEAQVEALRPQLTRQTIAATRGETTNRRTLESLALTRFDHVIVLCSDQLDPQRADSRVLVTLLHLRDIGERANHDFSIVSEMLDVRNRALAEVTKADDFIVSEKLVSLMLSQVSENKELNAVFADLFHADGSEIYVKPSAEYVKPGVSVNFATIVESARRRGEIAIGYRIAAQSHNATAKYGVTVNPKKSATLTFTEQDKVIVIAEE